MKEKDAPLTDHLEELRARILRAALAVVIGIAIGWSLSSMVLRYLVTDLGLQVVQIGITQVFMTQFRIGVIMGLAIAAPVFLYQVAAFVLPALTATEKRLLYFFLPVGAVLFLAGMAFAYMVVVPFTLTFFIAFALAQGYETIIPAMVVVDFVMGLAVPMGIVFELPVVVGVLARIGLVSHRFLRRFRKYAILIAVILGAVLTPPDPVSQILLAGPMLVLYEISIVVARVFGKKE